MLKFFAIIALLIIPCSATISVHIDTSTPNGLGISTGYSLDGPGHVETTLAPAQGFMEETGSCQGTCGSWISFGMISPHGVITTFWQDFSAHNRDTSWWYGVGNGMIGTSVVTK
jgi:hypothetical protein